MTYVLDGDTVWMISSNGDREYGYLMLNNNNLEEPPTKTAAISNNMTYKFSHVESKLISILLDIHGFKEVERSSEYFNIYWSSGHPKPEEFQKLQHWQKVNHFPKSSELTRKDCLQINIREMKQQYGDSYNIMTDGFIVPDEREELLADQKRNPGTWIVKPVAAAQGKGIYLVTDVDKIPEENSVVCRYIESPILLDGFKCDLRLYVAVTSLDPLVIYLYEEGLVRLASVKYEQGKDIWNPCIHLTNYSVNKLHSDYVKNEDSEKDSEGNKWSLSAFLCHLRSQEVDTVALMQSVEDVIIKAVLAAGKKMNMAKNEQVPHYNNCFELYGVDILIDKELKPWLIEFNLSPGLNIETPLDLRIKSAMLAQLFTMVKIQVADPTSNDSSAEQSESTEQTTKVVDPSSNDHSTEQTESNEQTTKQITTTDIKESLSAPHRPRKLSLSEELKIFLEVREELKRCGGWQQIFPTPDSCCRNVDIQENMSLLNKALHQSIYLQVDLTRSRDEFDDQNREVDLLALGQEALLERLTCYERHMTKVLSDARCKALISGDKEFSQEQKQQMKVNVMKAMSNGLTLSKYEARMAFSLYLQNLQQQLMNGPNCEKQVQIIHRFLCTAVTKLMHPFIVQDPDTNLPYTAQAIILCKQLGDFIQAYTKETHLYLGNLDAAKEERNIHVQVDSQAPSLHREIANTILQHNIFTL
ncbi:unnamed protein product [Meganyctiphanes norvegica]|uniref:Tubulin--tyrosine ligase-like protein 5 n=1 Tax=Meganyctiphanes norvegica TaxID=48144 RepID=A0AAV2QEK5_MEGNR